jgi:integrase
LAYTNLQQNLHKKVIETEQDKQINNVLNYAWEMKKNGRADTTISSMVNRLTHIAKLCNIYDPEQAKTTLALQTWLNSSKRNVAEMLNGYYKFLGRTWTQPKYTRESGLPFIPTEAEIDTLIATGKSKMSTVLQVLKETGCRIGELTKLQWTHIDLERKTIYITAEKGSNSRILPISDTLIGMLNRLPRTNEKVFPTRTHNLQVTIDKIKRRAAKKFNNPRLLKIHPHTFRHWKGTTEYHKTKDIVHVKTILGHKSINTTMVYINLENAVFLNDTDEWTCKVAHNETELCQLIETGFEYVTDMGTNKILRKRK